MRYDMKKPCDNCPFLRVGGIRVSQSRVREIAGGMLDRQGHIFPCHKTVDYDRFDGDDDHDGDYIPSGDESHCAGALIFAEKNGMATQIMRIMERIGSYSPAALAPHYDAVFDTLVEMLRINKKEQPCRAGSKG